MSELKTGHFKICFLQMGNSEQFGSIQQLPVKKTKTPSFL